MTKLQPSGEWLVVRVEQLIRLGGDASVAGSLIAGDVRAAEIAREAGLHCRYRQNGDYYTFRVEPFVREELTEHERIVQ